jgi:hypothetical protein
MPLDPETAINEVRSILSAVEVGARGLSQVRWPFAQPQHIYESALALSALLEEARGKLRRTGLVSS